MAGLCDGCPPFGTEQNHQRYGCAIRPKPALSVAGVSKGCGSGTDIVTIIDAARAALLQPFLHGLAFCCRAPQAAFMFG